MKLNFTFLVLTLLVLKSISCRSIQKEENDELANEFQIEARYEKSAPGNPELLDHLNRIIKPNQKPPNRNAPKRSKVFNDFYDYVKRHSMNYQVKPMPFRIGKRYQDY